LRQFQELPPGQWRILGRITAWVSARNHLALSVANARMFLRQVI